jgi:glycosyltransferase involved in cell wall biosynthesis
MKILLYIRHFFPSIGGTESSGRIMAQELAALGHVVTVATATPLPHNILELNEGYAIVRSEQISTLVRLARKNDLLLSRGGVSLRAFLAAFLGRVPVVVFHEFDTAAGRAGNGFRRHATDALKVQVRRFACLHVVVSDALRAAQPLPDRANWFKLYNPVSKELWTNSPPDFSERDLDVLFVGRLVTDKGIMVLRDALLARPNRKPLRVTIVGNGGDQIDWKDRFGEIFGEVSFLGPVMGDSLRELYARARIVVMPSIVFEGMGMVAAEALANAVPVFASDQPALREVVNGAGLFHPMGDASQLAESIDRVLGDPDLWEILSNRALAERARFSMSQYRKNLSAMLDTKIDLGETKAAARKTRISDR